MKICLISKYPPIEGGVSSAAYWLAKGLGSRGHKIYVATNAYEVEAKYREKLEADDLNQYQPENVTIYNTNPFNELHYIPYSKPYTEKIASLAIEIVTKYEVDLIDSYYMLPYVVSGYIVKTITNKPQILRHAGSDISHLFESPYLKTLFSEIFKKVDKIVTYPNTKHLFINAGVSEDKLAFSTNFSVDSNEFNPKVKELDLSIYTKIDITDCPIITYIGKVGATKGIFELTQALSKINRDFILLLVSNGANSQKLRKDINDKKLCDRTIFLDFLPPWKMPGVIKASTCVVLPERNFPIPIHNPVLPREAMCVGRCTVLSEELLNKCFYTELKDGVHTIAINPRNIENFRDKLEVIIRDPDYAHDIGKNARRLSEKYEKFDAYLESMEILYRQVIGD